MHESPWTCAACGYVQHGPSLNDLTPAAVHEAGHAVMRWRLGEVPGALCIHPDGSGFSAPQAMGSVRPTHDLLLITLAGIAAEAGGFPVDLEDARFDDLDAARQLLTPAYVAAHGLGTQDDALHAYYEQARKLMWHDFDLVEGIAWHLENDRSLSADFLREILTGGDAQG